MNARSALAEIFVQCRDMDASLAERLAAYSDAVTTHLPNYAEAVNRMVTRLVRSGAGAVARRSRATRCRPSCCRMRPGNRSALMRCCANGPLAITFHRGHWCPWCRISIRALVEVQHEIEAAGGRVVVIMPETSEVRGRIQERRALALPGALPISTMAMRCPSTWRSGLGRRLRRELSSLGRSLPDYQGNETWMLPIPATFVVGRDGW